MQRHNDYVHYESDAIAKILRKPLIGAVAARLAQAEEIRIFQSTMIYKPPIAGEPTNVVPWHFDKHYWASCTSEQMLTAFIPFHDCGPEMGTITMVDGSHRWQEIGTRRQPRSGTSPSGTRPSWTQMLAENAALQRRRGDQGPDEHPQGAHELPPLPDLPRQRPEPAATGRAGRSRCTCRTATNALPASSGCPTASWPATTTTPGPPDRRRPAGLRRPGVLPDAVACLTTSRTRSGRARSGRAR